MTAARRPRVRGQILEVCVGFWCVSEDIVPVSRACRLEYLRTPHEGHKAFLDRVAPTPRRTRPAQAQSTGKTNLANKGRAEGRGILVTQ